VHVVVTGATGNVGTSVLRALASDDRVRSIIGIARRPPASSWPKTTFVAADVARDDLRPHLRDANAVIHLAWLIQPSRDRDETRRVNVEGSARVFAAAAAAGVGAIVYASSVGAYSAGPSDRAVDESWPTDGTPSSFYAVDKAAVERRLDGFEREHPDIRVVRLRPGLIFKREAATEIRRLFAGPLLPGRLVRPQLLPALPLPRGLRAQAVHADDVGEAYRLALDHGRGAYNIAADPVLDAATLGRAFGARVVDVSPAAMRAAAAAAWRLRLTPTPPGWLDMALAVPVMDVGRARHELGWTPLRSAIEALEDLLRGMRERADAPTPPLARASSGPLRLREILTGIGARSG
jgi:nucleoside-diphosphate-sugar epimerase